MLWLGIIIGCLTGLMFAWWFAGKSPPLESFFWRVLRLEKRAVRYNNHLQFYELQVKVGELLAKVQGMDLELQELLEGYRGNRLLNKNLETLVRANPITTIPEVANEEKNFEGLQRCEEVERLRLEGLNTEDIARKLKIGKGEVELILSLRNKSSWVIGAENDLKKKQ
jgi:hypothetical protein